MNRFFKGFILFLLTIAMVFTFCACTQEAEAEVAVERITLNITSKTIVSGETFQIVATAYPENASQEFTYSVQSKYASNLTVSASGLLKGKNTGNDTTSGITVTVASKDYPSVYKTCKIYVAVAPPSSFSLPKAINMVTSGPGEDSSSNIVISWHAKAENSVLEYKKEGDAEYTSKAVTGTKTTANWADLNDSTKFYRCKEVLTGLTADTDYVYRIKTSDGVYTSPEAHFRTAASDTTFQFMWLSDLHAPKGGSTYIQRVKELIDLANTKDGVDLDFCLFTGDMVNKGQIYKHWNYWSDSGYLNNMVYAFVCGNHDYYPYGTKDRTTNAYFKDFAAYPTNNEEGGKSVLDSNYWFIWNRVLFVCIDNFTSEGTLLSGSGRTVAEQKAWFKAVVEANEGEYDYLVYAQHLPFFINDEPCEYGQYTDWYALFDEYKVDFALSSDEHAYTRTKPLLNNSAVALTEGKVTSGTIYITSFETEGSSIGTPSNSASATAKYAAFYGGGGVGGGVYFTVTPTEMTMHLIGAGGVEKDSVTVVKKTR